MNTNVKNAKNKPRIVLDTNILVSALVFGGTPREVTGLIAKKAVIIVMSEETLTELRRIIAVKFPKFIPKTAQFEKLLRRYARWVPLGNHTVTMCRDPDDNTFIETALAGNCDYIVSGDKDLLSLKRYEHIQIISPAGFLRA